MPVVSYRNACFMNSEMAGIDVDPRIIEMYQDKDRAQGEELGRADICSGCTGNCPICGWFLSDHAI